MIKSAIVSKNAFSLQRLGLQQADLFGLRYVSRRSYPKIRWVDLERPLKKQLERYATDLGQVCSTSPSEFLRIKIHYTNHHVSSDSKSFLTTFFFL